ncbi:MAG TPA: helix-turn-helix domain-containing protein [Hyphomicrobiaceae bacterium]|nr:helix-turn-helix domain-containing protein [Hyphomicrobiaceae bacterium]
MSFDALSWAAKQRPGNLAAKMVLLALANYANEAGEAYPSTAAIAEFGDMNHKTATVALDRLEALGLIADTGDRRGKSGQIKVYCLNLQSIPKTEPSQNREPPVFSNKGPQKRVTDTIREPVLQKTSSSSDSARPAKPNDFPKPDWADPQVWADFLKNRKIKKCNNTATAYKSFLDDIDRLTDAEWPPGRLLQFATAKGWAGIYDPRNQDARHGSGPRTVQQVAPDGRSMGRTEGAAKQALARIAGGGNRPLPGLSGPANNPGNHGRAVALPNTDRT